MILISDLIRIECIKKHSPKTYVYPPGKVNPVVNAVPVRNPAVCVAGINVGRCRVFIITPK